jgi:hypothetical protein
MLKVAPDNEYLSSDQGPMAGQIAGTLEPSQQAVEDQYI